MWAFIDRRSAECERKTTIEEGIEKALYEEERSKESRLSTVWSWGLYSTDIFIIVIII